MKLRSGIVAVVGLGAALGALVVRPTLADEWVWEQRGLQGAPRARWPLAVVWTGSKLLIWGGTLTDNDPNVSFPVYDGFLYDPLNNSWSETTSEGAPVNNWGSSVVWTGSELIIWGGTPAGSGYLNSGGVYDPKTDVWRTVTLENAPSSRIWQTTVWTGTEMIVWGGAGDGYDRYDAAAYDPVTDTWRTISSVGAPRPTGDAVGVWTGSEMIIWGGAYLDCHNFRCYLIYPHELGRYDPKTDSWNTQIVPNAPDLRRAASAIWTGSEMIVWGGFNGGRFREFLLNSGGAYDPIANTWNPLSTNGAPVARSHHAAVWTGEEMIIWGGEGSVEGGGRYSSNTDTWVVGSTNNSPQYSSATDMVWTGEGVMIYNAGLWSYSNPSIYGWDGIPDKWQRDHFGDENPDGLPDVDADGDLGSNRMEYIAGTNPTNKHSILDFKLKSGNGQTEELAAEFSPMVGGRIYELQSAPTVSEPTFTTIANQQVNQGHASGSFEITNIAEQAEFFRLKISLP